MRSTAKGYLCLVLHAHLPFVKHPEFDRPLEEDWLFEGITETYLPLLEVFYRLMEEGIPFQVTMTLSPPLMEMFSDPLLRARYLRHLDDLVALAEKEVVRTRNDSSFHHLALMYKEQFLRCRILYAEKFKQDLVAAFRGVAEAGFLEIITCGATHGYFPLMAAEHEASVRAQVRVAVKNYEKHLGRKPRGIWLPECGYSSGDDRILKEEGLRYCFLDTHGVLYASPRPRYGVFAPLFCPSGVAVFGRDLESSKQVWSSKEGYPGDFDYREFYRDVGWDLEYDYIRPHIHESGVRKHVGIKYYRITGATDHKEPYNPDRAREKAASHAGNFMFNREKQVEYLCGLFRDGSPSGKEFKPIIVAPYDAELFGHWWFEGPMFIDFLLRKIHFDQKLITTATPSRYLEEHQIHQISQPSESSWGWKGYHEVWLNGNNDWIYRHLHQGARKMVEVARAYPLAEGALLRALNQMAREILLAQSSDWAFIMKTGTVVEYAQKRTTDHLNRFFALYHQVKRGEIDGEWLKSLESSDSIFQEIDYRAFA